MCVLDLSDLSFFFKQRAAYEMRIRDWSSDVCSSYLRGPQRIHRFTHQARRGHPGGVSQRDAVELQALELRDDGLQRPDIHVSFERAAERHGHSALAAHGVALQ